MGDKLFRSFTFSANFISSSFPIWAVWLVHTLLVHWTSNAITVDSPFMASQYICFSIKAESWVNWVLETDDGIQDRISQLSWLASFTLKEILATTYLPICRKIHFLPEMFLFLFCIYWTWLWPLTPPPIRNHKSQFRLPIWSFNENLNICCTTYNVRCHTQS